MEIIPTISHYQRIERIGANQGRNSEVWRATKPEFGGEEVAVKEIPHGDPRAYFDEASAMFKVRHPRHIVPILYAGNVVRHGFIALVMPLYRRGSLYDRIQVSPLPIKEVIRVGIGILTGVQQIHGAGYIHFDIKPSNVLFSDADEPMIADFGQTRPSDASGTVTLPGLYPDGLPPEYFSTGIGTRLTDIYHVGLTLYRIANGDQFFNPQRPVNELEAESQTLGGTFPNRDAFLPHVPLALRRAIKMALSVRPEDRFQSADEFIGALAAVPRNHDWRVARQSTGSIRWECRGATARLQVDLLANGAKWDVEMHTLNSTRRPAKKDKWLRAVNEKQAMTRLRQIFRELG